jgi:hypothetical protein
MHDTQVEFIRRAKSDGSYDFICPICYLTAATSMPESALRAAESRHVCHQSIHDQTESPDERARFWPTIAHRFM